MSALPPKADIAQQDGNVRFGPISDIKQLTYLKSGKPQSVTREVIFVIKDQADADET